MNLSFRMRNDARKSFALSVIFGIILTYCCFLAPGTVFTSHAQTRSLPPVIQVPASEQLYTIFQSIHSGTVASPPLQRRGTERNYVYYLNDQPYTGFAVTAARTPITYVLGYADLYYLEQGKPVPSRTGQQLLHVVGIVDNTTGIVNAAGNVTFEFDTHHDGRLLSVRKADQSIVLYNQRIRMEWVVRNHSNALLRQVVQFDIFFTPRGNMSCMVPALIHRSG